MKVWWGWKWRCENVFGETRQCRDITKFVRDVANEVTRAKSSCREELRIRDKCCKDGGVEETECKLGYFEYGWGIER